MAEHLDLAGFLVLGLLGGLAHCAGMCTPFVLLISRRDTDGRGSALGAQAWYHAGRIATYIALGALAGGMGRAVTAAGMLFGLQRAAAVFAGAVLIVWGLAALFDLGPQNRATAGFVRLTSRLTAHMPKHPVVLGLVLGLLPCGLLYSAVVAAIARGGFADGAVALAAFGAGTVPTLLAVFLADTLIGSRRAWMNRASQVFVVSMGVWFLWRGLTV